MPDRLVAIPHDMSCYFLFSLIDVDVFLSYVVDCRYYFIVVFS